jgi:hypothetical protein
VSGGPDKKRSWNASKAFGHSTNNLELGEQRQVFHALRNTFTEAMEAAEVPESTTRLLIGHKRASLTYGHYSKGERVKRRKAIEKLKYAPEVMRLIRGQRAARGVRKRGVREQRRAWSRGLPRGDEEPVAAPGVTPFTGLAQLGLSGPVFRPPGGRPYGRSRKRYLTAVRPGVWKSRRR